VRRGRRDSNQRAASPRPWFESLSEHFSNVSLWLPELTGFDIANSQFGNRILDSRRQGREPIAPSGVDSDPIDLNGQQRSPRALGGDFPHELTLVCVGGTNPGFR
jgi:hypothetical protein